MLGALGVVYGDIGTSPLYAMKECFSPGSLHPVAVNSANVLGILSLVFWSLTMVIIVKYLTFILRADNNGAGGMLALLALLPKGLRQDKSVLLMLALFGAALLYGDGVITPAISVLSAVEGLEVATSALGPFVIPITLGVLVLIFFVQKHGTGGIGKIFGPVTLVWFVTIAALGLDKLIARPDVLLAIDPRHAVGFFLENGRQGFVVLGSVFLVVTGGEALYADMGHFGRQPIRRAWFAVVFPALLLNYFGQGALLLGNPEAARNPFFGLVPPWALYPVVGIATCAAVIASQAMISGAFSLTQQAVQLGFFPRVTVVHTSRQTEGQIYVPEINGFLFAGCVVCVVHFGSSSALASAYGVAVTGTMTITTVVYAVMLWGARKWNLARVIPLALLFLAFDVAFLLSNSAKFSHGGWFPIVLAIGIFVIMTTWHRGRRLLHEVIQPTLMPLDLWIADVAHAKPHRVKGTAIFMSSNPEGVPSALLHNFKHNQILHEQVVLLSIQNVPEPQVPAKQRTSVEDLGEGFFRVVARYGFMERPDVPDMLRRARHERLQIDLDRTSYYLGRETLVTTGRTKMARWRKGLFAFISRNARPATAYFGLPPGRVVELGVQVRF